MVCVLWDGYMMMCGEDKCVLGKMNIGNGGCNEMKDEKEYY